jgi:glucose/arabinose dehydrogenase
MKPSTNNRLLLSMGALLLGIASCTSGSHRVGAGGEGGDNGSGGSGETGGKGSDTGGKGGSNTGGKGTGGSTGGSGPDTGGAGGSAADAGPDTGGAGGDTGGAGGDTGGVGGSTGGKGGSTGGAGGRDAGAGGSTGGAGGSTGGVGGSTGGAGGGGVEAKPCSTAPAMTPPALKRGTTITGIAGQAGQVTAVPGEANVMYVISHTGGDVYNVIGGKVSGTLLHVDVAGNGNGPEQGLLGMAFHPAFAQNHLFYVFYTAAGGGQITVDEFQRMTTTTSMFKQNIHKHAGSNMYHNGGSIYFSPKDNKPLLYHSVGNAQSGGNSSNPTSLNGKVLRYDVSTKLGVPATGATGLTFAYGLRNPYRMSIDRLTGDIYIGEVADGPGGSIFFISGSKGSVTNFGYSGNGEIADGISGFQSGNAAIIGGVVYRGNKIPGLCGRYFFGMHANGAVKSFVVSNGQRVGGIVDHGTLSVPGQLSSFGEDGEGEIWMSSRSNNAIYKIEAQ